MKRFQSIRWRLPANYAGIALLTALISGLALILPLNSYYQARERAYLEQNAQAIAQAISPLMDLQGKPLVDLNEHIRFLSLVSQVRVRLLDATGKILADSGLPGRSQSVAVSLLSVSLPVDFSAGNKLVFNLQSRPALPVTPVPGETSLTPKSTPDVAPYPSPGPEAGGGGMFIQIGPVTGGIVQAGQAEEGIPADRLRFFYSNSAQQGVVITSQESPGKNTGDLVSVIPLVGTMYGYRLQPGVEQAEAISNQVLRKEITAQDGKSIGWVELSGGPAYGREIVSTIIRAWGIAALVAVLIAGVVGWWISLKMTSPLLALTQVTRRMAQGDLSVRAELGDANEIGSLAGAFNQMANQVEQTVQTLSRFAADAAHELHTPLTALRTNLELAQESVPGDEHLARAMEQMARMENLTSDLLVLSRIESGVEKNDPEPVDLKLLLSQLSEGFASRAEQSRIDFILDLPEDTPFVTGSPTRLQRAVENLIENALKFTPTGGRVSVALQSNNAEASIWVVDSGIGIPDEDLPQLFNRFHRGKNASGYPGSGLGLSIVKAIVAQHGGQVQVQSRPGDTVFTIILSQAGR